EGDWTITNFANYVGGYRLNGKTVLDVGTASGFLAFSSEKSGARVTALDARDAMEIKQVPFAVSQAYQDPTEWRRTTNLHNLHRLKNAWWYGWYKYGSKADVHYRPLRSLMDWQREFDVVIAGAIVEHLSDPVSAIGYWTKVAREAIIIAFTNVEPTEELVMRPITPWTDPAMCFAWFQLSAGLYRRLFDNLGFDIELIPANARYNR